MFLPLAGLSQTEFNLQQSGVPLNRLGAGGEQIAAESIDLRLKCRSAKLMRPNSKWLDSGGLDPCSERSIGSHPVVGSECLH